MPEGVVDSGRIVAAGVDARNRPPRERPADVPEDWVRDRKTGEWRAPRKRGPKGRSLDVENLDVETSSDDEPAGWGAERDPEPARLTGDTPAPPDEPKDAKQVKEDLQGILGLVGLVVLPPIARADPHCGGVLVDNFDNIADKCVPLIARSPRLVRWLTSAGGARDWVMLGVALRPVASAVVAHHITKTVQLEEDGGSYEQYAAAPAA